MKKRKFKVLQLKKKKISNLHFLNSYGGTGAATNTALVTLETVCGASCEIICKTYNPELCFDTTRTLADNTFNDTCGCDGFFTGVGC